MAERHSALRRLPFFVEKFLRDAFRPLLYPVETEDVHGRELGRYYLVFDEAALRAGGTHDFHFDDAGIPAVPTYIDVERPRLHYFPIAIGQYALAIFHTWLKTREEPSRTRFLQFADWFVQNQAEDGCWYAATDVPIYRLRGPWASAMSQGRGLSVLTRAWQQTGQGHYLEGAQRALAAFETPVGRGGGVLAAYDGQVVYEEYPAVPAPHVLNGMIFALFGIWDLVRAQPDNVRARRIFERGAAGTETLLPLYDAGCWSLYDLYHLEAGGPRNACTAHYHDMHIKQLRALHAITGRATFGTFASRWSRYQRRPQGRLWAYARKSVFIVRKRLR